MSSTTKIAAALFALAVGILPAAALGVTLARAAGAPGWIEAPFALVCHGLDFRSLEISGVFMPICARCTAIYAGALLGIALFLAIPPLQRSPLPGWILLLALLPMVLDGGTQAIRIRESTNALRVLTGTPAGLLFMIWILGRVERHAAPEPASP
jgi:uncharacterized membrane protein